MKGGGGRGDNASGGGGCACACGVLRSPPFSDVCFSKLYVPRINYTHHIDTFAMDQVGGVTHQIWWLACKRHAKLALQHAIMHPDLKLVS